MIDLRKGLNGNGHTFSPNGVAGHKLAMAPPKHNGHGAGLRVLIVSAGVGSGHIRAAEAIELALRQLHPDAFVHNVDVLTLATAAFRYCFAQVMYQDLLKLAPRVLGWIYDACDRPRDCSGPPLGWDRLRLFLETMHLDRFVALLQAQPWDLVINTHFLPGEILADLCRKHRLDIPQVMVTTDFETHHLWITEPCECYFTATREAARYLEKQGVPAGRTCVTGIPIHPVFAERHDRAECLRRQGLKGDRPIVLQMAGGNGVGRIEPIYRALLEVAEPLDLVVVTGRNADAQKRLQALPTPPRHRVKILGYTTRMHELLTAADLVVSKPGGLTTAEALACGTPLVIVDPVPGQEERNSDLLLENGAAIKGNHLLTLPHKVTALLRDPGQFAEMRASCRVLARPRAAFTVVEQALARVGLVQGAQKSWERSATVAAGW